jgi:hypothetical protein
MTKPDVGLKLRNLVIKLPEFNAVFVFQELHSKK